jgi:ParB/RepB/Spo0J family partition protein
MSMIDPILVRPDDRNPGCFIIVDGERRWRAIKDLSGKQIKCMVIEKGSDAYEIISLTKNIHREDLLPIEKAIALGKLLQKMKGENEKTRQRGLIQKVNLSETYISELLKMSKLDEDIKQEATTSKNWTGFKLLQLAKIKDPEQRKAKFEEFKLKIAKKIEQDNHQESDKNKVKMDVCEQNQIMLAHKVNSLFKRMEEVKKYLSKTDIPKIDDSFLFDIQIKLNNMTDFIQSLMSNNIQH